MLAENLVRRAGHAVALGGLMMETYVCKKCGEELYLDDIENWGERKCPECDEPIPWNLAEDELRDLTRR